MQAPESLASAFVAAGGGADERDADLDAALRARLEAGRAQYPLIDVSDADLVAHLARVTRDVGKLPPLANAADLYLACACALGAPRAVSTLATAFAGVLERAAARVDATIADEAAQMARERLLVRVGDSPPKIAEYGGRAKLSSWLSAVAAREAISARRRIDDRSHESLSAVAAAAPVVEPEIEMVRAKYAGDFREAIRVALARLEPRERALLRMNLCAQLSIDRIADVYKTSRATAARWLVAARASLFEGTRKELRSRLGLSESEIESLAGVMRSEMDMSVASLLGETAQ